MMGTSETPTMVIFRGGFSADWRVVSRLLELEARGAHFELKPDGGFRVVPPCVLTPQDREFLRAHRDEARRVVHHQADDSHLFSDSRKDVQADVRSVKRNDVDEGAEAKR